MRRICDKLQGVLPLLVAFIFIVACSKESDDPTEIVVPEPPVQAEAELTMVHLGGIAGTFDPSSSTFSFVLPNVSNFKEVNASFTFQGDKVLLGTTDISKGAVIDLTSPVKVKVVKGTSSKEYTLVAQNTGLPIVRILTPGGVDITSKDNWLGYTWLRIENADGTVDYDGQISIRGRGNSTWNYPKKPYAIKLDKKSEILGMPKHKRWVLLANWKDRTLMRNDAAFWLSTNSGLPYTVRGQFVEVELNGKIMGNYYLCEQIKVDDNRVDITEMEAQEHNPENLTGGYLVELDTYYDEVNKFHSTI
ncbi:MAG: CotH kinase family protein, partial [Bacteroidaceae bacterium]|nr:CotH kinase family protein [Bacteroidaceae bacterium]